MSDKTEEPTEKKLDDAKEKGQGPKSQDLVIAALVIVAMLVLMGAGDLIFDQLSGAVTVAIRQGLAAKSVDEALVVASGMAVNGLLAGLPMVILSVVVAILAMLAQVGVVISAEAVSPKFDRLNPAEGLKKIISVRSLIELGKSILKAIALGSVIWILVHGLVPVLVGSAYLSVNAIGTIAWKSLLQLLASACMIFIVVGPVDFGIQRWLFIRDNKMSKDDIKREYKESEGDPMVKGQRRQLQEEMATSAPPQRVPGATVVVTNPTHYAVALFYDPDGAGLPVVVAKGVDEQAAVIRELASKHNVPIVGNPPLARALYKLPLDRPVPEGLFEAVAVVLRWAAELDRMGAAT